MYESSGQPAINMLPMQYLEQIPTPPLRRYIEKFWYCQTDHFNNRTLTLPLLYHELVFNLSDYYVSSRNQGRDLLLDHTSAWISGIQTMPTISESRGKHEMMGVLFKPHGLKAFTKYPAGEFENTFVDATLVFDASFKSLLERLQQPIQPKAKILLMQDYLIRHLKSESLPNYVDESIRLFQQPGTARGSVKEICQYLSVSNKTLIQSYQKHVGVTPMKYMQIQSVNQALASLAKNPTLVLTELAHRLHFFDQSHFIHSFKAFTGLTPSQYANYVVRSRVDNTAPNFISWEG